MIKDTNPDHYKVGGANFIEYMNDPKLSGFGSWMFANGYNSGVWASTNWISVKDRLPERYERILTYDKYSGVKENWLLHSFPCVSWSYGFHVTHWMPLPEAPKEVENEV